MSHDQGERYRDAMQREINLRKVRKAGQELLQGRELYDFLSIKDGHDKARDTAEMLYSAEYKLRVNVVYKMLLKQATAKARAHKPRYIGSDRLDPNKLTRQAQMIVRFDHEQTKARIDERELSQSKSFMEKCTQRRAFVDSFKSAARPARKHTPIQSPSMTD